MKYRVIINLLNAFALAGLLTIGGGCEREPRATSHSSGRATIAGREIEFWIDGPGGIRTQDDVATVSFGSHKVRVEKERVLIDEKESATMPATVSKVEVVVSNATVTVTADSNKILTSQIAK